MYLGAPLIHVVLMAWPQHRQKAMHAGLMLAITGLVAASFATKVWHLILTQGLMYALGGLSLYFPAIIYVDEWFIQRKGMAYGAMWGGTGAGGIGIPLLMDWLLNTYGHRTALRTWAVAMVCVLSIRTSLIPTAADCMFDCVLDCLPCAACIVPAGRAMHIPV
jgi:hypothetical protein